MGCLSQFTLVHKSQEQPLLFTQLNTPSVFHPQVRRLYADRLYSGGVSAEVELIRAHGIRGELPEAISVYRKALRLPELQPGVQVRLYIYVYIYVCICRG